MANGKRSVLSGIRGWLVALAGIASAVIAYMAWAHPKSGSQTFSIVVSGGRDPITGASVGKERSIEFKVKKCELGEKRLSCSLSVLSPGYDRRFSVAGFGSYLVDDDGDRFALGGFGFSLGLERDQEMPFKLSFDVNKNIALPARVVMNGSVDNQSFEKSFPVKIASSKEGA